MIHQVTLWGGAKRWNIPHHYLLARRCDKTSRKTLPSWLVQASPKSALSPCQSPIPTNLLCPRTTAFYVPSLPTTCPGTPTVPKPPLPVTSPTPIGEDKGKPWAWRLTVRRAVQLPWSCFLECSPSPAQPTRGSARDHPGERGGHTGTLFPHPAGRGAVQKAHESKPV